MTPHEFDALSLPEQQVIARETKDAALQGHIINGWNVSLIVFLAANVGNLSPALLHSFLSRAIRENLDNPADVTLKGTYSNLSKYAPRMEFYVALFREQRIASGDITAASPVDYELLRSLLEDYEGVSELDESL